MAQPNRVSDAKKLLAILVKDRDRKLKELDQYVRGIQADPYTPENADQEYHELVRKSKTNVMDFIVASSAQAMYVDGFRHGNDSEAPQADPGRRQARASRPTTTASNSPEWKHWQTSRLDARQAAIYRGALIFGHSFALTEIDRKKRVITKGLSALRTAAIYEDPANDDTPIAAIHVLSWPRGKEDEEGFELGKARMWDETGVYEVTFKSTEDFTKGVSSKWLKRHGASECPITRFTAAVDLEGRTCGVVEPMIPLQDRINQTVFDMLVVQSYASFKVKTITGMAPPVQMKPVDAEGYEVKDPAANEDKIVDWVPRLDSSGKAIPEAININAKRVFWAEDHEARFDTLDETPLDGFIEAIKLGFQHMAALSQTPPHHLLGQVANLSAEALIAAEQALSRKVDEFKSGFGESWERVFRLAAEIGGWEGVDDYSGEVIWRDMESRSLAQAGDALGKLAESLGIPRRGLWPRVPGVTSSELAYWEELEEEENVDRSIANAVGRSTGATTGRRPGFRSSAPPEPAEAEVA